MLKTLFPPLAQSEPSGPSQPPKQQRLLSSVRQDKGTTKPARIASLQPAALKNVMRAHDMHTNSARAQNAPTKRKTVKVTLWVKPAIKAELKRLADLEDLSISKVGGTFLEDAMRQSIHQQYASLIQPIIEQAIAKHMRGVVTKLTWLFVRIAFDSGQTRSLVTNLLGRQPGMTPDMLDAILDGSSKTAKNNVLRRTPQIASLIAAIEQWLQQEEQPTVNG